MKNLLELIDENRIRKLATPANFRLGREIATQGGVELTSVSGTKVVAKVHPPGGQKRTIKCRCT
jgi:hypothetical protein